MKRWAAVAAFLGSCGSEPEVVEEERPRYETVMKESPYAGFIISREATERFLGYFEPVVTLVDTHVRYAWRFRSNEEIPEPILFYIDHAKSGIDLGNWRHKLAYAVGRLKKNVEIGTHWTPGADIRAPIRADVLELVAIDTEEQERERAQLEGRVQAKQEERVVEKKVDQVKERPLERIKLPEEKAPEPKPKGDNP